jgi:hypothetical protein
MYCRQVLQPATALAYCSPEEFERKAENQAENRGATIEVFVNNDNDEKTSKGLLGTGTQMLSPSPDPFSCYKMQRGLNEKTASVPNFLSQSRGSGHPMGPSRVQ